MQVVYGVEGPTDAPVARKLIEFVGREPRQAIAGGGKSQLDPRISAWNTGGNRTAMLALRDWDANDACACAGELVEKVTSGGLRARALCVRIAVRAVESWILADHVGCRQFFGFAAPHNPDTLADPKLHLVNECRLSSKPAIRNGMVPQSGTGARVGPLYRVLVAQFGREHWDVARAVEKSPSLARAVRHMRELVDAGLW